MNSFLAIDMSALARRFDALELFAGSRLEGSRWSMTRTVIHASSAAASSGEMTMHYTRAAEASFLPLGKVADVGTARNNNNSGTWLSYFEKGTLFLTAHELHRRSGTH